MKVELGISLVSNVAEACKCPQTSEWNCGINYRSSF